MTAAGATLISALAVLLPLALPAAEPGATYALPPTCAENPIAPDQVTPLAEIRKRVEALSETDPTQLVPLLCATIPRAAREYGEDSPEFAWWLGSLATPLIAYLDRFAEAVPLMQRAQAIFEQKLGRDSPELADIHVAYAWIAFRQGKLADAGREWQEALRLREITPGARKIELQKALVGLAHVQIAQREFAQAQATLDRAHAILVENGETVSEAAAAIENAYTNVALRQEDFVAARRHAEKQIDIEKRMGNEAAQRVPGYVLLGTVLERQDEFEAAEEALREAIRLSESKEGPLQRHVLRALVGLAALLNERGRPAEALEFARRAVTVGETTLGPDAPTLIRPLLLQAEAHRMLGELPEALRQYERASRIVESHRADVERHVLVAFYRGFGGLEQSLGDSLMARQLLNAGMEAAGTEATLSLERAQVLLQLARTTETQDPTRSREHLGQALDLLRARLPDSHPTLLRVINEICGIEIAQRTDPPRHCEDAAARLARTREIEPALRSAAWGNQSELAERRGDAEDARTFAIQQVSAATTLGTPDPLWRAYFQLARLLHEAGGAASSAHLAIMFGKQSIAQIERLRGYFVGEYRRYDAGFLRDKVAVYRAVADWLMEAGRIDEALEVLRLLKSEELYDFVLRDTGWTSVEGGPELTGEERRLWERYTRALGSDARAGEEIDRLSRLKEAGRISVTERKRLEELLAGQSGAEAERTERIRAFLGRDVRTAARAPVARDLRAPGLARELQRFGDDAALAFFLMTEDSLRLLIATREGQSEYRIELKSADVSRQVGSFLDAITRREDVRVRARELYELVAKFLDETAQHAGARRLVLWLDGPLRYLPFAALYDGERYLVDKYAIQIYAEPSNAGTTRGAARAEALAVRGLGVTASVAGYRALPAVADELCYIVRGPIAGLSAGSAACPQPDQGNGALPGEGFADAAFTETRLRSILLGPRDFSVLHLGTHFSLRPGNARRSFLVLGDGARLTLDAIGALDFQGVDLMTLSACQTGLGGAVTDDGREVEGLSALVQRRGARRVVASLWQVEDVSTAHLMRSLYGSLAPSQADAALALQSAQLALRAEGEDGRRPYDHPYYWAGFVVSGAAR